MVLVAPPGDEDVARILARVLREAKKDWADLEAAWPEDEYEYERATASLGVPLRATGRTRSHRKFRTCEWPVSCRASQLPPG